MFLVLALHPLLRRLYNTIYPISESQTTVPSQTPKGTLANTTSSLVSSVTADARLNQRVAFDLLFAAVFLCALHGFSAPKVLLILYTNFMLATRLPKAQIPLVTWIFNVGILFANEYYKGYPYGSLVKYMLPGSASAQIGSEKGTQAGWGSWLDAYGGLISRWEILFNITVLRLISFDLDYYWSLDRNGGSPIEVRRFQIDTLHCSSVKLTVTRRSSLIPRTFPNEKESTHRRGRKTIHSVTISHTSCTHRSIWLDRYSPSMTTFPNYDTPLLVSSRTEPSSTPYDSSSHFSPWNSCSISSTPSPSPKPSRPGRYTRRSSSVCSATSISTSSG